MDMITSAKDGLEVLIKSEHDSDQQRLDALVQEVGKCTNHIKKSAGEIKDLSDRYDHTLRPSHDKCRSEEKVMHKAWERCVEDETMQKKLTHEVCTVFKDVEKRVLDTGAHQRFMTARSGEDAHQFLSRVRNHFCEGLEPEYIKKEKRCSEETKVLSDLTKKCAGLKQRLTVKTQKCEIVQQDMLVTNCKLHEVSKTSCASYKACYDLGVEEHGKGKQTIERNEKERKLNWRGVQRIKCIVVGFKDGLTETEIRQCKDKQHPTSHLNIRYDAVPGQLACDVKGACRVSGPCSPPEAASYELVREVNVPRNSDNWDTDAHIPYSVESAVPSSITRVAYCLELDGKWAWTSFDETNSKNVGIPVDYTADRTVDNLHVFSNDKSVSTGTTSKGKVEFWDHCYGHGRTGKYDSNDQKTSANCYGSMQVHSDDRTVWAFNGWSHSGHCDVQIGNAKNGHGNTDGTFNRNCDQYGNGKGKLRVYVQTTTR